MPSPFGGDEGLVTEVAGGARPFVHTGSRFGLTGVSEATSDLTSGA